MYRRSLYNPLKLTAMVFAIVALGGCRDEITTTDKPGSGISFGSNLAEGSRAEATPLSNFMQSFRVYGIDGNVENGTFKMKDVVFPNYVVKWSANSANTTQSNSSGWEYVGQDDAALQTIKYWDDNQECHYFWAVADKDKGSFKAADGYVTFKEGTDGRVKTFTCYLTSAQNTTDAGALYYSRICKVDKTAYGQPVKLEFIPYLCRVRIGFYETVPGYVVNNLTVESSTDIVVNSDFISEGTCTLTYDYDNSKISTNTTAMSTVTTQHFGAVQYQNLSPRTDGADEDGLTSATADTYLARSSESASFALGGGADKNYYVNMLPYENRTNPLTFKCNYNLVDAASGSSTEVRDVMVSVPVEYAKWEPGYEYTYIFKISSVASTEFDLQVYVKRWNEQEVSKEVYNW